MDIIPGPEWVPRGILVRKKAAAQNFARFASSFQSKIRKQTPRDFPAPVAQTREQVRGRLSFVGARWTVASPTVQLCFAALAGRIASQTQSAIQPWLGD